MKQTDETFHYTYSAKEQTEVRMIRDKYSPPEVDKITRLRRLDEGAAKKGMAVSLVVGVLGTLVFGFGMCCCTLWNLYILGIIVGILGSLAVAAAYPLYNRITKKEREKIAPEILKLTDELLK